MASIESNTSTSRMNQLMLQSDNTGTGPPISTPSTILSLLPTTDQKDLHALVSRLENLIKTGNRVVCLGHSQGSFFCNLAYQIIQADMAGSKYALPNANVLQIASVATPAS